MYLLCACHVHTDCGPCSLTTVSLSRLLLNLRGIAYRSNVISTTGANGSNTGSHMSSLDFSRFVGPLGNAVGNDVAGLDEEEADKTTLLTNGRADTASTEMELEPVEGCQV